MSFTAIRENKILAKISDYSNFDKDPYKDLHMVQCTEPTPLALDNVRPFSSNSTKFSVVIENAMGYRFSF